LPPTADVASSTAPVATSGPITQGAMAILVTPIACSCMACCSMLGGLSSEAGSTGRASRAASSTEVTLAMPDASGPPTVTTRIPSAEVVMLNMRTRSARARPASASRMCSTSASSALVLNTSEMQALAPLAEMASRMVRIVAGCADASSGTTIADGAPAGRLAAASARTARMPSGSPWLAVSAFARRISSAGLSSPMMDAISAAGPVRASPPMHGTASTSAGEPSGRLDGTARRCRPPGCISRGVGCRTGKPAPDWRAGRPAEGSRTSVTL